MSDPYKIYPPTSDELDDMWEEEQERRSLEDERFALYAQVPGYDAEKENQATCLAMFSTTPV